MILVIGGAYQGKLDFVISELGADHSDVVTCKPDQSSLDTGGKVINGLEQWVYSCVSDGRDPESEIDGLLDSLDDRIVICGDISCGLVPMDAKSRLWREQTGRVASKLAKRSKNVFRVFCGIGTRLK